MRRIYVALFIFFISSLIVSRWLNQNSVVYACSQPECYSEDDCGGAFCQYNCCIYPPPDPLPTNPPPPPGPCRVDCGNGCFVDCGNPCPPGGCGGPPSPPPPPPTDTPIPPPPPPPTSTPTPTNTPTPTPTPTNTPTPTPYVIAHLRTYQGGNFNAEICQSAFACGSATGSYLSCLIASDYTAAMLQSNSCAGIRTPKYIFDDILGITPAPAAGYESNASTVDGYYGWPKWLTGLQEMTLSIAYNIRGWVYRETSTNPPTYDAGDSLLSGFTVNLSGAGSSSTTTGATQLSPYNANYIFNKITDGTYNVALAVTPTGSVLYPGFTDKQIVVIAGGAPAPVDFPFVTITPVGAAPTNTPTPSVTPVITTQPTPTSILATPPASCLALPTPVMNLPEHQICTATKPTFSATVSDPNGDNAWAHFYSNAYETFSRIGIPKVPPGGASTYLSDNYMLNTTGGYWWTAYTQSSTCPRSADAPARLINMDFIAPPKPDSPNCTLQSQSLVSGKCTFSCSWLADPEPTPASCSDTADYHPVFTTSPAGGWDPGWIGNILSTNVVTNDGQILYAKLQARDGLSNTSSYSTDSAGYTCPKINYSATPTPGGPTYTPTPTATPTITPSPTITPTPTPGDWVQVGGADTYQKSYNYPIPAGKYFITNLSGDLYNSGIAWSGAGAWNFGYGNLSDTNKKVSTSLTNAYNFSYFIESLKNKEKVTITDTATVGTAAKLDATHTIYSYSGLGYYTLDTSFTPKTTVTIFLISGSLEIPADFTIPVGYSLVFVVNGNINVKGTVREIPGFYISSQTFSVATGPGQFTLDGMVFASTLSLNRTYKSFSTPAYQFIYQPQYAVALLPYLGRNEVNWQEVGP